MMEDTASKERARVLALATIKRNNVSCYGTATDDGEAIQRHPLFEALVAATTYWSPSSGRESSVEALLPMCEAIAWDVLKAHGGRCGLMSPLTVWEYTKLVAVARQTSQPLGAECSFAALSLPRVCQLMGRAVSVVERSCEAGQRSILAKDILYAMAEQLGFGSAHARLTAFYEMEKAYDEHEEDVAASAGCGDREASDD